MISSTDLIKKIAENTGHSQKDVKETITAFWNTVAAEVEAGEEVRFMGIGKFYKKHTNARTGRNPQTGAAVEIAATDKLAFKSSVKFA